MPSASAAWSNVISVSKPVSIGLAASFPSRYALRVVVGTLLLVLGLSWLRKAILRASGHKAMHDEDKIYAETVAELSSEEGAGPVPPRKGRDSVGFAVAFKGVFLEGMEVVLIVISLGAAQNRLGLAALAAGAAVVLVGIVGLLVAR